MQQLLEPSAGDRLHSKELPAPFTTTSFAELMISGTTPSESDFAKNITKKVKLPKAQLCRYTHARHGLLRRKLSICNPVLFFLLSREIDSNRTYAL